MKANTDDFIDAPVSHLTAPNAPTNNDANAAHKPTGNDAGPKKRIGRPTTPPDYDGSTPLPLTFHEAFVRAFCVRRPQDNPADVVQSVSPTPMKRDHARARASGLLKRTDIQARLAYLSRPSPTAQPTPEQPETQAKTRKTQPAEVDADEIARTLSAKIREGDRDTVQAVTALLKIRPELVKSDSGPDDRPDPAAILGHVLSFAGSTPDQVAASMGGWLVIRGRLCALLRVSPSELIDRLRIGVAEPDKTIAP